MNKPAKIIFWILVTLTWVPAIILEIVFMATGIVGERWLHVLDMLAMPGIWLLFFPVPVIRNFDDSQDTGVMLMLIFVNALLATGIVRAIFLCAGARKKKGGNT